MALTPEQVADWLAQASNADLAAVGRPSTLEKLLFAAQEGMRSGNERMRELGSEVEDVLRRCAAERAPH